MKVCATCRHAKPLEEFNRYRLSPDGRQPRCRACQQASSKRYKARHRAHLNRLAAEWNRLNPERVINNSFRKLYGINITQYDWLLRRQNGVCAVCGQPCKTGKRLAVDHDHRTGAVRGLLCGLCNTAAGALQDDPQLAGALARYLNGGAVDLPDIEPELPPIVRPGRALDGQEVLT
jgi:Autographiviridae endonuclease VII